MPTLADMLKIKNIINNLIKKLYVIFSFVFFKIILKPFVLIYKLFFFFLSLFSFALLGSKNKEDPDNAIEQKIKDCDYAYELYKIIKEEFIQKILFNLSKTILKISKYKYIGLPIRLIFKLLFLFKKFSLSYKWITFYLIQQFLLWSCLFIWFFGYTYDYHNDRFLYQYFLTLVVVNYNIYMLGVYLFKIKVMKPFDYLRGLGTMFFLNWIFFYLSLPIWYFIFDHMDKGMTYKSIKWLQKYEAKLDSIPMFEADLKSRISIKEKKEIAKAKIERIIIRKRQLREERRLKKIAEKKTFFGALKHLLLDSLWVVANKIAYKKTVRDALFMMRAKDVTYDQKPVATEIMCRLLVVLKRTVWTKFLRIRGKSLKNIKNYLAVVWIKVHKKYKTRTLKQKYYEIRGRGIINRDWKFKQEMAKMNVGYMYKTQSDELTEEINKYKKDGLMTKREKRDLRDFDRQFGPDDVELSISLKKGMLNRLENRKQKQQEKIEKLKEKNKILLPYPGKHNPLNKNQKFAVEYDKIY